jgi:hypothetical protein
MQEKGNAFTLAEQSISLTYRQKPELAPWSHDGLWTIVGAMLCLRIMTNWHSGYMSVRCIST